MSGMTLEEFEDAQLAEHEGRASGLWRCPDCDTLQGELATGVSRGADPTRWIQLRCGYVLL